MDIMHYDEWQGKLHLVSYRGLARGIFGEERGHRGWGGTRGMGGIWGGGHTYSGLKGHKAVQKGDKVNIKGLQRLYNRYMVGKLTAGQNSGMNLETAGCTVFD